jgi:hypothetical protein
MSRDDVSLVSVPGTWREGWQVFDAGDYMGLVVRYDGQRFRAYGVGLSLDLEPVQAELEFTSRDEAVEWLLDGHLQGAGS